MSHHRSRVELPVTSPGCRRYLEVVLFGDAAATPKAYLQTGLHADENPGMLVMHHLLGRLHKAAQSGRITGQIILVPIANPIGLGQSLHGRLMGRYDLNSGGNFNRGYPDLVPGVAQRVEHRLGPDARNNVRIIRSALCAAIDDLDPQGEADALRRALLRLAAGADICLDLHCDFEAVMHVYFGTPLWPDARDRAADLGSRATLLAEVSGGHPFDEAVGGVWWALAKRFPNHPIPPACLSATVELRGEADIADDRASEDADGLVRFLCRRGLIAGDPGPLPALARDATPLEAVDLIRATRPGVVVYHKTPGDEVQVGECVAEIVDPLEPDTRIARSSLHSRAEGLLFSRHNRRFAYPGQILFKSAGRVPLPGRSGLLLSD